ncbi:tripartite tricarboxylate transporter substrate binding protein [Aminobacter aminovorans]|uniref:Bug family tripartite tricarboxylate transporter substrate binding protein n=1 Tax=Aminobacter TaxID=31988 RepID=UPI0028659133|nr:tripartite tricarboxylate transporter substrate binding protein [Aminobacter aminovorans]MDR7223705.1 tripartite-type tricarboxylate transporter receptor subunit TctC [Aminobacter aminovorans]
MKYLAATLLSGLALSLSVATITHAADFPSKPVTLVVPWPAGGGSDILMRMIAQKASEKLTQPVVVVNQPGAGGSLALREVADGDTSGHVISMVATGFVAEQYGNPNAPTLDQFKVLAFIGTDPSILAVRPDLGVNTLAEFVAKANERPGEIRNANDQPGGTAYIGAAFFEQILGVDLNLVPYPGSAPVVQAILAGEVQTATPSVTDLAAQHASGDVKILGVAGSERHFKAPEVPTFTEQGFPLIYGTMRALVAPAGVDEAAAAKLEEAILGALKDEAFVKTATDAGFTITPMTSAEGSEFFANLDKSMYPILNGAGLVKVRQK